MKIDWSDVALAAASSISIAGRVGYKATLQALKPSVTNMTKRQAYDLRSKVKSDYRLFDPIRNFLNGRDRPFELVRDPIDSFARTNAKWDVGLTAPGAAGLGANLGQAGSECDKDECE